MTELDQVRKAAKVAYDTYIEYIRSPYVKYPDWNDLENEGQFFWFSLVKRVIQTYEDSE